MNISEESSPTVCVAECVKQGSVTSLGQKSALCSGLQYLHPGETGTHEAWNEQINLHLNYLTYYYKIICKIP